MVRAAWQSSGQQTEQHAGVLLDLRVAGEGLLRGRRELDRTAVFIASVRLGLFPVRLHSAAQPSSCTTATPPCDRIAATTASIPPAAAIGAL